MMVGPTYRHNKDGIIYWVGDFDREAKKFIPYDRRPTSVDCGIFDAHVPKQLNDGRWIMFGYHRWKNTTLGNIPYWANCTVLPREMYLYGNTLCFRPMKEWDSLITETTEYGNVSLQRKVPYVIEKTTDAYKLTFTLEKGKKKKGIDISFLVKTEGDPWSVATLTIETDGTVRYKGIEEWFTKDMFDPMFETEFTIYVDGGVIEIFVKEKQGEENISRSLVMSGACIIHNGHKLDRVEITGQGILSNICLGKIECIWQ